MIYLFCGLSASAAILLHQRPPHRTSPLWAITLESPSLTSRLRGKGNRTIGFIGVAISFSILFLVAALRYGIGTDYFFRYVPLFERIQKGDIAGQEMGFVLLNRAVGLFTDDYQAIFVAASFLTIALFYRFFLRMSTNPALSVFIFAFGGFYLEGFNLVQQALAIALLVNTIEFALRKKHLAFVIVTLLAASFHSSALVWFVVWPLMWIRVARPTRIAIALTMIGAVLIVPQTLSHLAGQLAPDYSWYLQSNYGVTRSINPAITIVAVAAFVFSLAKIGNAERTDRYADSVVNLLALSTAVLVATTTIAYLFVRLNYYFAPIQLLAVPFALSLVRDRFDRQLLTSFFMSAYLTSFVFQFLVWNAHGVLPYESIFSR